MNGLLCQLKIQEVYKVIVTEKVTQYCIVLCNTCNLETSVPTPV